MPGTILLGYDIETASENTAGFLAGAEILHDKYMVPWTIYCTGKTIEARLDDIRKVLQNPLVTLAQHTYSHMLLKSVYMQPGDGKPVHGTAPIFFKRGGTLEQIHDEIQKTNKLIFDHFKIQCRGLTTPWGYYRGLADRPDILEILQKNGIQWVRSYARDFRDCQPTPFEVQPFSYSDQGFGEILELGVQGYQDDFYWDRFDDRKPGSSYEDYLMNALETVAQKGWTWSLCSHDHGTPAKEKFLEIKGRWLEKVIKRAKELGIRFCSPPEYYQEISEKKK